MESLMGMTMVDWAVGAGFVLAGITMLAAVAAFTANGWSGVVALLFVHYDQ